MDDARKWKEAWRHLGSFCDAVACPKVDLRADDPEDGVGFWGRKPECSSFGCSECGFGKAGGIPLCKRLEESVKEVEWNVFKDVTTTSTDGKVRKLQHQTVPTRGRLSDLLREFKNHSKLYMAHHAIAKWQMNCHGLCLRTFRDGDLVIQTDFAEKYTHQPRINMMMPVYAQTTLMVAIVHFSPQTHEGGGRVHVTKTWIFASEDGKHDCDFHLHALARIADHYLHGGGSEATAAAKRDDRVPRIHMFTDGCAKTVQGQEQFSLLGGKCEADWLFHRSPLRSYISLRRLSRWHRWCREECDEAEGEAWCPHRGGGRRREVLGQFLSEKGGGGEEGMRDYFATWSPYRVRRMHVKLIGLSEIYRPESDLKGIEGIHSMYHFEGKNIPHPVAATTTEELAADWKAVSDVEPGFY